VEQRYQFLVSLTRALWKEVLFILVKIFFTYLFKYMTVHECSLLVLYSHTLDRDHYDAMT
jgi:hypothetical protein